MPGATYFSGIGGMLFGSSSGFSSGPVVFLGAVPVEAVLAGGPGSRPFIAASRMAQNRADWVASKLSGEVAVTSGVPPKGVGAPIVSLGEGPTLGASLPFSRGTPSRTSSTFGRPSSGLPTRRSAPGRISVGCGGDVGVAAAPVAEAPMSMARTQSKANWGTTRPPVAVVAGPVAGAGGGT